METTNTNTSEKRFSINNFKQEIKFLAQLQHDVKLFFKHPERYPNFIEEHEDALRKEQELYNSPCPDLIRYKDDSVYYWQVPIAQSQCEYRRIRLATMYEDYYALKHWKKLNIDDDKSMLEYFFRDTLAVYSYDESKREEFFNRKLEELSKLNYIEQSKHLELMNMNNISMNERMKLVDALPKISWFDMKRKMLLEKTDKEV